MRRLLLILTLLSLLPAPVAAVGDAGPLPVPPPFPAPSALACPPVDYVDGVPVPPSDAPADCVYISEVVTDAEPSLDPCTPDETGLVPPMCEAGPVDAAPELPTYRISEIQLASGDRFTPAGAELVLGEGSLGATVGCNRIGGGASLGEDGSLDILQLMTTEMYCPELAETEQALLAVLGGGNLHLVALDGGARLESSTGTLLLAGAIPPVPATAGFEENALLVAILRITPWLALAAFVALAVLTRREARK